MNLETGNSGAYYLPAQKLILTACGKLRVGPKVAALLKDADPDFSNLERICSFVYIWHLLEWKEMREPEETP